jgi:hypothetical protein
MQSDFSSENGVKSPRRGGGRGAGARLTLALLELAQGHARLLSHSEKSWASITFAGTRHRYVLEFDGAEAVEAGDCFIVFLPEHEFALSGQLVADAAVTEVDHMASPPLMRVTCELLLLEEG